MIIERKQDEILVRLSASIDATELQDLLDFLKYQENSSHAKTNQAKLDKLAEEVNSSVWKRFKEKRGL